MTTLSASKARKRLYNLVDEVNETHEPVQIVGERSTAVLVADEDWRAIQETLYLTSIPGMRESIKEGLQDLRCLREAKDAEKDAPTIGIDELKKKSVGQASRPSRRGKTRR